MSNIPSIQFLTYTRIFFWYTVAVTSLLTRTHFIIQTWSNAFIIIVIFNTIHSVTNLSIYNHRGYYRKLKYFLIIFLPLLTCATIIIYVLYMHNLYYRIMNLLIINIMNNDRTESLLSDTLNYYRCCRVQEDILFDSVNERDYFIIFSACQKVIEENEMNKDQWNTIRSCAPIFRSVIFSIQILLILDLILALLIMIASLIHIWEEIGQWINENDYRLTTIDNINYKMK
ncbi:unnamed protein product [Rotaria socialis]